MNNWTGIGRLVADPELRYATNGTAIVKMRIAVGRPFKNQQGERETDFVNVTQFGKAGQATATYQKKGNQIAVEGRLQISEVTNKEGKRQYFTEIVANRVQFLDKPDTTPL